MQIRHDGVVGARRSAATFRAVWLLMLLAVLVVPASVSAQQQQVLTQPTRTITLARGGSAVVTQPDILRMLVSDPAIAEAEAVSPREIVVRALTVGTTSLLIWDRQERITMMAILVTPDIGALQRQIETLFPNVPITLSASGTTIIVSGTVRDPHMKLRILEVVRAAGGTVIDNMQAPSARQVLLHVRFAEVNRTFLNRVAADLRLTNPQNLGNALDNVQLFDFETLAEGAVRLFLLGDNGSGLESIIRALKTQGHFRSLAEPNLVAVEGQTATFLAGGEFPYPSVQPGAGQSTVTISWKEFGVRLNFTPQVTNIGTIRLDVEPEVSSLDFANGLTFGGFQIPALLTRRTKTSIEMGPGQVFAIAGLLDNTLTEEWQKIPLLGDLPILGAFFRSRSVRDRNTELLVLVTPHLVEPVNTPPELPTGEPSSWNRTRFMREGKLILPTGVRIVPPGGD